MSSEVVNLGACTLIRRDIHAHCTAIMVRTICASQSRTETTSEHPYQPDEGTFTGLPAMRKPLVWSRIQHLNLKPFANNFGVTQQGVDRRVFVGHVFQLGKCRSIHARSLINVRQA